MTACNENASRRMTKANTDFHSAGALKSNLVKKKKNTLVMSVCAQIFLWDIKRRDIKEH